MTDNNAAFLRFLPPVEIFEGGDDTKRAEDWLSSIKRLKTLGSMTDTVILTIAGSNMKSKAQTWWGTVEDEVTTWKQFENKFTTKFMKNRIVEAWEKIKTIQQQDRQDCSEIIDTLNPLFKTVNLSNNDSKISFFIASIKPTIAYELAREKATLTTYEEVTDKAIEIEKLQRKYKIGSTTSPITVEKKVNFDVGRINIHHDNLIPTSRDNYPPGSELSDGRISADSLSELINAVNKLNINLVQHGNRNNQNYRPSPVPEKRPLMC